MKKIYLDTNILIDILLDRDLEHISINKIAPFLKQSKVYMSSLSVHITYYILKIKANSLMHRKAMPLISSINLVPLSKLIPSKIEIIDTLNTVL